MEKLLPATAIKRVSEQYLIFENLNGIEESISLRKCRDNWYKRYNGKESIISKLLQKRKKCKYVGDRFWSFKEAYFVFYSDIKVKFLIDLNEQNQNDDTCEARQYFGYIKDQLRQAGWLTFDVG